MRLGNQPEMTVLKTLVKAAFKNAHSDKKAMVTLFGSRNEHGHKLEEQEDEKR